MEFIPLAFPGLVLIRPRIALDARGSFVKSYSRELFLKQGIDFVPQEEFYSISPAGVVRGMHFQAPPADYGKLVHCPRGRLHDVALDLRAGSPTYGQAWSGELDEVKREALYLPPGFAHGFYALEAETTVTYLVSHGYDPALDGGIRWDSFGHTWPGDKPVISARDSILPPFHEFSTPFTFA